MLVIAKMLRMSSSTISTFLPASKAIGIVQALEQLALVFRQARRVAMQPERRLIVQALRAAHVLDDHRLREPVQLRLLLLARGPSPV